MRRSKSELKITDDCLAAGLRPRYEQRLEPVTGDGTFKLPDFTFVTAAGEAVIWEHLGMVDVTVCERLGTKAPVVRSKRLPRGETLFTTSEIGGLQSSDVAATVEKVRAAIEEN